jgi:hypothetical protein
VLLLEASPYFGGRTASWNKNGMEVEAGLHRILGFYTAFPDLVKKAGLKMKDVVIWEEEIEVKVGRALLMFMAPLLFFDLSKRFQVHPGTTSFHGVKQGSWSSSLCPASPLCRPSCETR